MFPWKQRLVAAFEDIPVTLQILGALASFLVFLVPGFGLLIHRHRLLLLDVPEGALRYGADQLALAGITMIWRLPWRMLLALFEPATAFWAVALAGAAFGLWLVCQRRAVPAVVTLGLLVSISWFALAFVQVSSFEQASGASLIGADGVKEIRRETVSWLINKDADGQNRRRREALAGLLGWLSVATFVTWRLHARCASSPLRRPVDIGFILLLLFLVGQWPRLHAYAYWGQEYPQVAEVDAVCDAELRQQMQLGCAWGWHISMDSQEELMLLEKENRRILKPLTHPSGGRCLSLSKPSIVGRSGVIPRGKQSPCVAAVPASP